VWYARMRIPMEVRGQLAARFEILLPHLNERQQRWRWRSRRGCWDMAACARSRRSLASARRPSARASVNWRPARRRSHPPTRARWPGGGRRPATLQDPDLVPALLALVEPDERGDPQSPLRWTTKSLRHLAEELTRQGHPVSAPTVGRLLKRERFSLQANVKTLEGAQHPDRDAQFRYLNQQHNRACSGRTRKCTPSHHTYT
jgi:Rhodopirellula transposase DDE domain